MTNNSDYIRPFFYNRPRCLLTPAQIRPKLFASRRNFFSLSFVLFSFLFFFFFFTRGGRASCLRVCLQDTLLLPQFSTQTFRRALAASVDSSAEIKELKPLQWRNQFWQSLEEGAGKRCWECGASLHYELPWQTPSLAFRHLPPDSARPGYATEGALFISAHLSTDAVSALHKV